MPLLNLAKLLFQLHTTKCGRLLSQQGTARQIEVVKSAAAKTNYFHNYWSEIPSIPQGHIKSYFLRGMICNPHRRNWSFSPQNFHNTWFIPHFWHLFSSSVKCDKFLACSISPPYHRFWAPDRQGTFFFFTFLCPTTHLYSLQCCALLSISIILVWTNKKMNKKLYISLTSIRYGNMYTVSTFILPLLPHNLTILKVYYIDAMYIIFNMSFIYKCIHTQVIKT